MLTEIQATKGIEYLIAIAFLGSIVLLWRFLRSGAEEDKGPD